MCQVFKVTRSGYYDWLNRSNSERKQRKERLVKRIKQIFLESRRLYGSPKITKVLQSEGEKVSQKTVARIMKEQGLRSRTVKKSKATTNFNYSLPVHDNKLNQQFIAEAPNQVWMADITYISTDEGWLYLASIVNLYQREIVGWYADKHMTKSLVLKALYRAYKKKQPKGQVLHHSDRGSQYASKDYQDQLEQYHQKGIDLSRKIQDSRRG